MKVQLLNLVQKKKHILMQIFNHSILKLQEHDQMPFPNL